MIKELVEKARQVEMDTFKKYGMYEKRPTKECWEKTGKAPIGVKWVDTNKGDAANPEYRCRLVAKEIKHDEREDWFVCGHAAARGQEDLVLVVGRHGRQVPGLDHRRREGLLPFKSKERSSRGAVGRRW